MIPGKPALTWIYNTGFCLVPGDRTRPSLLGETERIHVQVVSPFARQRTCLLDANITNRISCHL